MNRERALIFFLIVGCFAALIIACFGECVFRGRQFAYRDAGHFYYPLYERVQQEWNAGRWPLWEPEENAGMPLLGNPTAAVLYPGKAIFAVLPYPLAARLYVVAHLVLALVAMLVAMRSWGTSWVGSAIAAMSYAFGAPVLFQYCNIIYLVGAAWLPLGFLAVDRWIRGGSLMALPGLAVVLALQTLGGDPQSAYLLGLCGGGYALGLAWARSRQRRRAEGAGIQETRTRARFFWLAIVVIVALLCWIGGALWAPRNSRA